LKLPNATKNNNIKNFFFHQQNKNKESSKGHSSSASTTKSETEQTESISLSNDTESIKKQEPKKQVNIVISFINKEKDDDGIGQLVGLAHDFIYWLQ